MSVFSNPHMEDFLREQDIDTLLMGGFMTGQCVYHSVVDGIKKGFNIVVLEDLTADSKDRYETNIEILFHQTGASISDINELEKKDIQAPSSTMGSGIKINPDSRNQAAQILKF
jgi:nicotinamidase-related amidase